MILLDEVVKIFPGDKHPALDHVSLNIQPKEFVFLVGKSGAGKSTLIKMLTREEIPTSGKIMVGGIDYEYLRKRHIPHLRRRLGVVFQDYKLLPNRTVYENVAFALEIVGVSNKEIRRTVPKVLELVGLADKAHKFPSELSGGEKQRVAIARSMARQPKILIADEPTGNLDPETSWGIVHLLEEINNFGTTILVTTHDEKIVNCLKRRVITLRNGKIVGDQKDGGHYNLNATKIVKRPLATMPVRRPGVEAIRRAVDTAPIDLTVGTARPNSAPIVADGLTSPEELRARAAREAARRRTARLEAERRQAEAALELQLSASGMNSFSVDPQSAEVAKAAVDHRRRKLADEAKAQKIVAREKKRRII